VVILCCRCSLSLLSFTAQFRPWPPPQFSSICPFPTPTFSDPIHPFLSVIADVVAMYNLLL
jgi:hypothetical protein